MITWTPPSRAAISAPSATSRGPRSAPLASTATVAVMGRSVVVVVRVVAAAGAHLTPRVRATHRADPVRTARAVTGRARVRRGRADLVRGPALGGAGVRLLLLGD